METVISQNPIKKKEPLPYSSERKRGFFTELKINRWLYLMLLPGLAYFLIFNYVPLAGLYFAFVNYNFMAGFYGLASPFVGLQNFKFFFTSQSSLTVTFNTLFLNTLFISTGLFMQVVIALALNELGNRHFKKMAQSFMFLPNFLSWTVVAMFSLAFFGADNGFANKVIVLLGGKSIDFYSTASVWPALLVFMRLWKGVGFGTVIFLAAIAGLDQEMYEAARIDGANRFRSAIHLTLPLLKPTIVMLLIMSVGGIFNGDFGMIYALVGDNPLLRPTTDVIDTYVYRALRLDNDIGMSAAVGLFQSVLGFIMVLLTNFIAKKIDKDTALF